LVDGQPFATVSSHFGEDGSIATENDAVRIAYSAAENIYTVTLPDFQQGQLVDPRGNGSFDENGWINLTATTSSVTLGTSSTLQPVNVTLQLPGPSGYSYSSLGFWTPASGYWRILGYFVYGTPTAAGDMPITGSANYGADVVGQTSGGFGVWGSANLNFDFGAGTLTGEMNTMWAPEWDAVPLATYSFRDTVYSTGSTTFSGAFNVPGSSEASAFTGSFNGPQGAEIMANWHAPYLNPYTNNWDRMGGVWIGKKN
jgi:hypothetical protein